MGVSKAVKKDEAVAPSVPNVENNANPSGPQLQAPAAAPINTPKIPPLIF